jgi:flagellar protein FlgJ
MDPKTSISTFYVQAVELTNRMNRLNNICPKKGREDNSPQNLKKACADFESMFIHLLLKEMREAIPRSDMFGHNPAKEMYTSMFDVQMAKQISDQGGTGLARMLQKNLVGPDGGEK